MAIVATMLFLAVPRLAFGVGDINSESCAGGTEASPGFRSYLPDCRAYELVTPPYTEGGVLQDEPAAISEKGEQAIIAAAGTFGGADNQLYDPNRAPDIDVYRLARTESGWQPTVLTPPASSYPRSALLAASADPVFGNTLWGAETTNLLYKESIYLQEMDGTFVKIGPGNAPAVATQQLGNSTYELGLVGASGDLTRSVFSVEAFAPGGHSDLWAGDTTVVERPSLYEYVYKGVELSEPLLVGVSNHGPLASNAEAQLISACGTELGAAGGTSTYNAISADGETLFFTARAATEGAGKVHCNSKSEGTGPAVNELYARIDAADTIAISEPSKSDCEVCNTTTGLTDSQFVGASKDGTKVFFMTEQELLPGQKGTNLYEYDFGRSAASPAHPDGKISLVSTGSTTPEVQGVTRISEDGSRVYFVAKGVLAGANPEGKAPVSGADNLYVSNTENEGATPVFVATLLTPAEEASLKTAEETEEVQTEEQAIKTYEYDEAEIVREFERGEITFEHAEELISEAFTNAGVFIENTRGTRGPSGTLAEDRSVWQQTDRRPVQANAPDGRFLVFPSSAELTAGDESIVPQLFEYDAHSQRLARISIGQGEASGNVSTFHDAPQIPSQPFGRVFLPTAAQFNLAISSDGTSVFFTSAAKLTPTAVSGAPNVFEYRGGAVYLLSDGSDATDAGTGLPAVQLYGADPSGRDVFFTTADGLVPQAGGTQQALYDAREEGGFPAPALEPGCLGETCRGVSGATPGLSTPGSAGQDAEGSAASGTQRKLVPTAKSPSRKQKLAKALKACQKLVKKRRATCRARARVRYAQISKTSRLRHGSGHTYKSQQSGTRRYK